MSKSSKGGEFERLLSVKLSLWWTEGERDDIFWRSSGSGGRATARGRRGASTYGHNGDIAATDPLGDVFIRMLTIELKRGYNVSVTQDLLDRQAKFHLQEWERWIGQVTAAQARAGTPYWMIANRRDSRVGWVYFPYQLLLDLRTVGGFAQRPWPYTEFGCSVRDSNWVSTRYKIFGCLLEHWCLAVQPKHITALRRLQRAAI